MKCEILLAAVATFAAAGSACKNLEGIVQRPGEERTSERMSACGLWREW